MRAKPRKSSKYSLNEHVHSRNTILKYKGKPLSILIRRLLLPALLAFIVLSLTLFVVLISRSLHDPIKNLLPQAPDLSSQNKVFRQKIESEYKNIRKSAYSGASNQQIGESIGNLGKLYHANNFYEHAEQCYQVAIDLNPGNSRWLYYLAMIKQTRGQNDSAVKLLEKMLSSNPGYTPAILKLADLYYKGNQINKAKASYEKCLYLAPFNLYAHMGLARIPMDTSEWEVAQKHLEKAIESNPDFAGLHRMMALVHEHFGRTDQMQKSLDHAEPMTWRFYEAPDPLLDQLVDLCYDAQGLLVYASKLRYRNSPLKTSMLFQRALELDSKNPQVYHVIGDILLRSGFPEKACICFEKMLVIDPQYNDPLAFNSYGMALVMLGKLDQGIKQFIRALELDEKLVETRVNLGNALCAQGKFDEGLEYTKKAIQLDPNDPRLYFMLGISLAKAGKLNEAAASFEKLEKVIEIDVNSVIGSKMLTEAVLTRDDLKRAVQVYKKLLEISPDDADAHKTLGDLLVTQYKKLLEISPDDADAHKTLGILVTQDNLDEAIRHYRRALQIKPDYVEALYHLAWLLATRRDTSSFNPEEAVRIALKACTLTNYKSLELMDTLAVSYAASGEFSKAVTLTEQALQLADSAGRNEAKTKLQKRLELFKSGQPYFEDGK